MVNDGEKWDDMYIPSGKLTVCYWKWFSKYSGFSQLEHGDFPQFLVSLPEGKL